MSTSPVFTSVPRTKPARSVGHITDLSSNSSPANVLLNNFGDMVEQSQPRPSKTTSVPKMAKALHADSPDAFS